MNVIPSVTILVEGKQVEARAVESALKTAGGETSSIGASRGLLGDAFRWVFKFTGDASKVGNSLVDQVSKHLAGATVKVQSGQTVVEVTNANRSQVLAILKQAAELSKASEKL